MGKEKLIEIERILISIRRVKEYLGRNQGLNRENIKKVNIIRIRLIEKINLGQDRILVPMNILHARELFLEKGIKRKKIVKKIDRDQDHIVVINLRDPGPDHGINLINIRKMKGRYIFKTKQN